MDEKKEKKDNRLVKALYYLADALNDNLFWKIFFQALPIIWTTAIVQIWHSTFYNNETGNLNELGITIAVILAIISIFILILTNVKSSIDKKEKEKTEKDIDSYLGEIELRRALSEAESTLEDRRNRHFRHAVEDMKSTDSIHAFVSNAMYPMERINTALDGLSECFSKLSGISKTDFTLSGAVSIENKNSRNKNLDWDWISIPTMEGTASITDLLKNKSAFSIVANGMPYYYANDKKIASKKGEYYIDGRDKAYGIGSIVCAEIDEEIGKWRIRLILSISTYGKQITNEDELGDGVSLATVYEDRIRDIIIKQFEGELKEDLLWYAIEKIDFEHGKARPKIGSNHTASLPESKSPHDNQ